MSRPGKAVRPRGERWRSALLGEPRRLRQADSRHRCPHPRRCRRRCRGRARLLDEHGNPAGQRRLDRTGRPRRTQSGDDRSARRHVHAEAAAPRRRRPQAVLGRSRGDAGDALRPGRLERRDAGADGAGRRRPPRRDPVVCRSRRRPRRRTPVLDPEGPERRGRREDPAGRNRHSRTATPRPTEATSRCSSRVCRSRSTSNSTSPAGCCTGPTAATRPEATP